MTVLNFEPFDKNVLITQLTKNMPNYKIQNSMGALQVRTSGFTVSGNVKIDTKPKTGKITTSTNFDMVGIFLIFLLPLGIYIYSKKDKQKQMEKDVIIEIEKILGPRN